MKPVLVHYSPDPKHTHAALAENDPEHGAGVYVTGDQFGAHLTPDQRDNPDRRVWFEYVDATDEHRALAEKYGVVIE